MRSVDCPECGEQVGAATEGELVPALEEHLARRHRREGAREELQSYVAEHSKDAGANADLAFRVGCGLALYSAAGFPLSRIESDTPIPEFFGTTASSALALAILCLLVATRRGR